MKVIDQNSAINSLNQALVPGALLIDGRTEQDMLCFLSDFASLINFYDQDNNVKGNWAPFLLKDSVFLMAHISKTRLSKYYSIYRNTCDNLQLILDQMKTDAGYIAVLFNHLFDQLTHIFMLIKQWVYYMQKSDDDYTLKIYVIYQTKNNFSKYFWALISLRQNLFLTSAIPGIKPIDSSKFYFFDDYEEIIWKQNKDKTPYLEILGLENPIRNPLNTELAFFSAITNVGDKLFNFFHTIIQHSNTEFEKLKLKKSKYPDTVLLRTFVDLLQVHQDQLNGISQQHLQFYYTDILKQTPQVATPDNAFICADAVKPDTIFNLPAGTLFNAGVDAQKNNILFANADEININPATITNAYTMAKVRNDTISTSLYSQTITNPGVLKKDDDDKILGWSAFGGSKTGLPATLGIAIASPMLLLREGIRTISLTIDDVEKYDVGVLENASYYLSTQTAWFEVPISDMNFDTNGSSLTITISLKEPSPAILPFTINPDGLTSIWPMLKIAFNGIPDKSPPSVLTNILIEVNVVGAKTFQLYNDNGALSTKTPYQPFGPTPLLNSNFIIGSNEVFSKPLTKFCIAINWNNLPAEGFTNYYQAYNDYLQPRFYDEEQVDKRTFFQRIGDFFKWIWIFFISFFNKKKDEIVVDCVLEPYNNFCFITSFSLLQQQTWGNVDLQNAHCCCLTDDNSNVVKPQNKIGETLRYLFVEDKSYSLCGSSFFSSIGQPSPDINPDPSIQSTDLKFTDASTSGFVKMQLGGNKYGFGSGVYPNVVSYLAFENARILINDKDEQKVYIPIKNPANLPFAPKVTTLTINYNAKQAYTLNTTTGGYPVQCFLYAPFSNYLIYDSSVGSSEYNYIITTPINKASEIVQKSGIPLYQAFDYDGYLLLEMENLIESNSINLYFELTMSTTSSSIGNTIGYYYLSTSGWKKLPVIADGTNNLSCSGIITVNVPGDITNQAPIMPGNKYWFTITVKNNVSSFPEIVFLKVNGFEVQRTGNSYQYSTVAPKVKSNTITKTQASVPQITNIMQPFPSFGGKAAESPLAMNQRVSNRIKTKDRAITPEDYYRLTKQEFSEVYHSKTVFNTDNSTKHYVIKGYESATDPGAFIPLVSECAIGKMQDFLINRTSAFTQITVSNFQLQYVLITAILSLKNGYGQVGVDKAVNDALNIYLSPWISSSSKQIIIDSPVSDVQVMAFIKTIEGVESVESVIFQTWEFDDSGKQINTLNETELKPLSDASLFVSSMNHNIILNK